jgi:hypothetical protein
MQYGMQLWLLLMYTSKLNITLSSGLKISQKGRMDSSRFKLFTRTQKQIDFLRE